MKLITENEVAERWSLDAKTLRNWRCNGKGPDYIRLGYTIRYRQTDVEAFEAKGLTILNRGKNGKSGRVRDSKKRNRVPKRGASKR